MPTHTPAQTAPAARVLPAADLLALVQTAAAMPAACQPATRMPSRKRMSETILAARESHPTIVAMLEREAPLRVAKRTAIAAAQELIDLGRDRFDRWWSSLSEAEQRAFFDSDEDVVCHTEIELADIEAYREEAAEVEDRLAAMRAERNAAEWRLARGLCLDCGLEHAGDCA